MYHTSEGTWPGVCRIMCTAAAVAALATPASAQSPAAGRALAERYCIACHDDTSQVAGISFEQVDWNNPGASAELLEKAIRKVSTGEMPPAGMPRPTAPTATAFTGWLVDSLDKYAAAHPNPGRPAIHRLNRAEYSNAIRDLLALDTRPGALLPVDDSGYGFDNVADVLSVSPALLERYMTVARRVSRMAVGDPALKSADEEFSNPMKSDRDRVSDDLPFDSGGGMSVSYYFPLDAEYNIRIKLGGEEGAVHEIRMPVQAGLRTVGATFLKDSFKPEVIPGGGGRRGGGGGKGAVAGRGGAPLPPAQLDLRLDGARVKIFQLAGAGMPQVDRLVISGPYNPTGRGDTHSRERIFVCRPATKAGELPCARTILTKLARRAFRRDVNDADIKPLLAFYERGRAEGDFDHGIEKALGAMLVSPDFLFRVERDPKDCPAGTVYRLNDFALASRISFFLWSSIPDDQLLDLAEQGKLKDPVVLRQQVGRMLDDPRSQSLVDNFAGQWLYLRNLELAKPDPDVFPEFDENLKESFRTETSLFFQNILREDHSILELLDADYTFLNQRLAEHYGIPNVYGPQFRKVTLTDPDRGGLLGQGSVLTVTSYPNRTSVVQRGKWILETLLGTPPPPPPVVQDLKPHGKDGQALTMRQQMEQHRSDPVCASCHARMDPLGFALENYDGVGKWRDKDAGNVIDASGKLPDGSKFVGPAELKKILVTSRREEFVTTAAEKLLLYALGRGLEYYDLPAVRAISRQAEKEDFRMSALVTAIVSSTPFQMRRTPDE
jgi:mono/diheme cytochrome c family protein